MSEKKAKYKSKLEAQVAEAYPNLEYEVDVIEYIIPESKHKYLPDWKVCDGVYIETKGKFTAADRKKHLLVKEQNPEITVYLLFQNSDNKLNKRSKTTYGMWCDSHGIPWADWREGIPKEWLKNNANKTTGRNRGRKRAVHGGTKSRGSGVLAGIFNKRTGKT